MTGRISINQDGRASQVKAQPQAGLSLIEVITAIAVLGLALMGSVSSLLGMAGLDDSLRYRTNALRAANSKMETILAYDYSGDINDLIAWLGRPDVAIFTVEDLPQPEMVDLDVAIQGMMAFGGEPQCGSVLVDASDPQRVRVTIEINWRSRNGEPRSLRLPMTISAVAGQ